MLTDVGEYLVGAYLKVKIGWDFVDYNVRPPGGGLEGLGELDVIGLDTKNSTAYLCEVTTHIRGVLYKDKKTTLARVRKKYERQQWYAKKYLKPFPKRHYMFWSPVVPKGALTEGLEEITGLELFINGRYRQCIEELRQIARSTTHDPRNPALRLLQILEHLRD